MAKEEKKEEKKRNVMALRLPYGLCKRYGIALPEKATPREAWDALKGRTGKTQKEIFDEIKPTTRDKGDGKTAENAEKQKPQSNLRAVMARIRERDLINLQEKARDYLSEQGISRYDKAPSLDDSLAERKYNEMMERLEEQRPLVASMTAKTQERVLSFVNWKKVEAAKRALRMDIAEDIFAAQQEWRRIDEIERYVRNYKPPTAAERRQEKENKEAFKRMLAIYEAERARGKDITSTTYERAQKRSERQVSSVMGFDRR